MTEPATDKRTPEQKNAANRHSIITWTVFIGGLGLLLAAVDLFLLAE